MSVEWCFVRVVPRLQKIFGVHDCGGCEPAHFKKAQRPPPWLLAIAPLRRDTRQIFDQKGKLVVVGIDTMVLDGMRVGIKVKALVRDGLGVGVKVTTGVMAKV